MRLPDTLSAAQLTVPREFLVPDSPQDQGRDPCFDLANDTNLSTLSSEETHIDMFRTPLEIFFPTPPGYLERLRDINQSIASRPIHVTLRACLSDQFFNSNFALLRQLFDAQGSTCASAFSTSLVLRALASHDMPISYIQAIATAAP